MEILAIVQALLTRLRTPVARATGLISIIILGVLACPAQNPVTTEGWVVLPVDDYRALRAAAFPKDRDPEPAIISATLTRVEYDLKVDGDLAAGEARLTVDVIKDGWVRVAIPAGLMIRESHLDGQSVSLVTQPSAKGPSASYLLLSRAGRFVLTLAIAAPVSAVAGTQMLHLPTSASAISRASIVLAGKSDSGVDVRVTGGLVVEKSDAPGGSRCVAYGRGNELLSFAWKRRVDDQRAAQPLRLRGAITQLIGLGEDSTQISAEVQIEVTQGLAKDVRLEIPGQFTVNQVFGAMVADWESTPRELIVTFLEPVQQAARFTVSGEMRLPREGKIDVPLMRLSTAERETGGVAVEVLGAGEIKDRQARGLEEAEAADLGQLISSRQSPSLAAFRLRPAEGKSLRSLSLVVARYTPQAVLTANVEEAQYNALITDDGKMLIHARFAVRNNQRSFLKLNLPSNAALWTVSVAGRPIRPGRGPDGSVLAPLEKAKSGEEAPAFVVEVAYLDHVPAWNTKGTDKGRTKVSLLTLDMPISKSSLMLHHPPLFRLTPIPGSFRLSQYQQPESTVLRLASGATSGLEPQTAAAAPEKSPPSPQSAAASRPMRNLPIRVAFPHFGPYIFLISELTSENQTPVVEIDFQRERKRGEQ